MKIQLSIIGLGQIGTSVGLALAEHKDQIKRIGHDTNREAESYAKKNDAVDSLATTLSGAVKDADMVLLALPFQEIKPVLEHICQHIKKDTLVIDTSPLKGPVVKWVNEYLPENCQYVGFTPVIGVDFLNEGSYGFATASKDLFTGNLMGIIGGPRAEEEAINTAIDLTRLLGAFPYFADQLEIDGLMSMTYILPLVVSGALLKASQETPGWREARKVAGKAYNLVSNPFSQDEIAGALAGILQEGDENVTRVIDDLIRKLVEIRDLSEITNIQDMTNSFAKLQQERDIWLDARRKGDWIDTPKADLPKSSFLTHLIGIRRGQQPPEDK
jgi:prephenate dehydrogenase